VISKTKKTISANFLVGCLSLLALAACASSDPVKIEANTGVETSVYEKNYRSDLFSASAQFEIEFVDFYLGVGNLTEDLLTDFLENSEDANKGYLAAIKRIRSIDDSTNDLFHFGTEVKHLTSDEIDLSLSENDKILIIEINPLAIEAMNLASEFLQVARDAATALSIVDKPTWVSLQDELVEIAQKYYETGTARGRLYKSLGESLEDESLRASFYDLGETF
jgi:hypothetical protein